MIAGRARAILGVLFVASALALLFVLPPESGFYPACPIHALTGTLCPGCGGTRALHALLHGRIYAALAFNPIVTLAAAPALALAIMQCLSMWRRGSFQSVRVPRSLCYALAVMVAAFWIGRNAAGC